MWYLLSVSLVALLIPFCSIGSQDSEKPEISEVVFAGSANYPPFQWIENGKPKGFVIDLQNAMGDASGVNIRTILNDWPEAIHSVETGEADAIALMVSDERRSKFAFSRPLYYLSQAILSHPDGPQFATVSDLEGYSVAVVSGSYSANRLPAEVQNVEVILTRNERECLEKVHNREVAACIESTLVANQLSDGLNVIETSPPFWYEQYAFGVKKENEVLLLWLNQQIAQLQATGNFFSIYQGWQPYLEWQPPTLTDHLRVLLWMTVPLASLILIGLIFSWYFKKKL